MILGSHGKLSSTCPYPTLQAGRFLQKPYRHAAGELSKNGPNVTDRIPFVTPSLPPALSEQRQPVSTRPSLRPRACPFARMTAGRIGEEHDSPLHQLCVLTDLPCGSIFKGPSKKRWIKRPKPCKDLRLIWTPQAQLKHLDQYPPRGRHPTRAISTRIRSSLAQTYVSIRRTSRSSSKDRVCQLMMAPPSRQKDAPQELTPVVMQSPLVTLLLLVKLCATTVSHDMSKKDRISSHSTTPGVTTLGGAAFAPSCFFHAAFSSLVSLLPTDCC